MVLPNRQHLGNLYLAAMRSFKLGRGDPLQGGTAECPKMVTAWFRGPSVLYIIVVDSRKEQR